MRLINVCLFCALQLNAVIGRYGGRMTLTELDPTAVERWVSHKQAQVRRPAGERATIECLKLYATQCIT